MLGKISSIRRKMSEKMLRIFLFFAEKMSSSSSEEQKFQEELCWCLEHLETSLKSGKLSEKQGNKKIKMTSFCEY